MCNFYYIASTSNLYEIQKPKDKIVCQWIFQKCILFSFLFSFQKCILASTTLSKKHNMSIGLMCIFILVNIWHSWTIFLFIKSIITIDTSSNWKTLLVRSRNKQFSISYVNIIEFQWHHLQKSNKRCWDFWAYKQWDLLYLWICWHSDDTSNDFLVHQFYCIC